MKSDFCPDCGHLLSKRLTHCAFCGWSDRIDYLAYRGLGHDKESDLLYTLTDDVYSELVISV